MNRAKFFITATLLSVSLIAGPAFAAEEGAVTSRQKSTEKGTMEHMGSSESHMSNQTAAQDVHRVSEFVDANVKGSQGENLGKIKDVIISGDGKARYIVLSKGGFLGMGAELIAIPFDVAQPLKGPEGDYTLNIDELTLDQAPTVAENDLDDATVWEQDVRGYFGETRGMHNDSEMQDRTGMHSATDAQYDTRSDTETESDEQIEREARSSRPTANDKQ